MHGDEVLARLRERLEELAPGFTTGSVMRDGILLGRGGAWAVTSLRPGRFDIGVALRPGRPDGGRMLVDSVGGDFEVAVRVWGETSAACFLELATGGTGRHAAHLPGAVAGWHTISSGVIGYGPDAASNEALRDALLDAGALGALTLEPDRPRLNGVKIFLSRTPTRTTADVRVNGRVDLGASRALARRDWPEVAAPAMARFYAVAVHPS